MKIKVEYSESIQVAEGLWRKIGIEIENEHSATLPDPIDILHNEAKAYVQRWHKEDRYHIDESIKAESSYSQPGITPIIDPKQSATERMLSAINSCTEVKTLESFKLLVKSKPEFQAVYDKKMEELTNV